MRASWCARAPCRFALRPLPDRAHRGAVARSLTAASCFGAGPRGIEPTVLLGREIDLGGNAGKRSASSRCAPRRRRMSCPRARNRRPARLRVHAEKRLNVQRRKGPCTHAIPMGGMRQCGGRADGSPLTASSSAGAESPGAPMRPMARFTSPSALNRFSALTVSDEGNDQQASKQHAPLGGFGDGRERRRRRRRARTPGLRKARIRTRGEDHPRSLRPDCRQRAPAGTVWACIANPSPRSARSFTDCGFQPHANRLFAWTPSV